jgi:CRP/FNR family cyclic AMP-dependent transcriptional regulator
MDDPILTIEERAAINNGRWFSSLSPRCATTSCDAPFVKRYKDGDLICCPRRPARGLERLAKGAVRVSSTARSRASR